MKQFVLFLMLGLVSCPLLAQRNLTEAGLAEVQEYRDFKNQNQRNDKENNLVLYFYPCLYGKIDLRDFKRRPDAVGLAVPDFKPIVFPHLSSDKDTVYAVGRVESRLGGESMIHIILISGYNTNDPIYYVDKNADGDYTNDTPFSFQERKYRTYHAKVQAPDKQIYEFSLYSKQEIVKAKEKQERLKRPEGTFSGKHFTNNSVYMSFGLTTGNGKVSYSFRDRDTNYPTDYTSHYFPVGFVTSISYSIARLSIAANVGAGIMNNYSSQRDIQVFPLTADNPFILESNYDGRPKNFLNYGLTLGYNIKTASIVTITPEVGIYKNNFLGDKYQPNRRSKPEEQFDYTSKPFITAGIAGKLALNESSLFFIKGSYEIDSFDPDGYFASLNTNSVNSAHFRIMFNIGLQWRLGGKAKKVEE